MMTPNESDLQITRKGDDFDGMTIALCVGGGIAATESVKLIREFRRYGAEVTVYLSKAATKFITPLSLEWASGRSVVTKFSGLSNHLFAEDILVVAPATANLISKVTSGISDTVVSCVIASALGRKDCPKIFFPTMHQSLWDNPFFQNNLASLQKLSSQNLSEILSPLEEGKIKIPPPEDVVLETIRQTNLVKNPHIAGKKILITGGMVPSFLDEVRFLANLSTGGTAKVLADYFYRQGVDPILLVHQGVNTDELLLSHQKMILKFKDFDDYLQQVMELAGKMDGAVFTAGVSDFKPAETGKGKKSSENDWPLTLAPNKKVIAEVKKSFPELKTVAFKLITSDPEELFASMNKLLLAGHEMVVGNLLDEVSKRKNMKRYLLTKNLDSVQVVNNQTELAATIYSKILC